MSKELKLSEEFLNYNSPESWQQAEELKDRMNENSIEGIEWSWDCNFKLDFDGSILRVSSRFYPPRKCFSGKWEGNSKILLLEQKWKEMEFKCDTLPELEEQVKKWVYAQVLMIKSSLSCI